MLGAEQAYGTFTTWKYKQQCFDMAQTALGEVFTKKHGKAPLKEWGNRRLVSYQT